jgi:hypothetical protein
VNNLDNNYQITQIAENIWNYIQPKINKMMSNNILFFRAQVISNPGDGTLNIQRPFDSTILTLPCLDNMKDAAANSQVLVMVFGSLSGNNAIVVSDGKFSSIGGGNIGPDYSGDLNISGNLTVEGSTTLNTLTTTGKTLFGNLVTVNSALTALSISAHTAAINGELSVATLSTSDDATIGGELVADNGASFSQGFSVDGNVDYSATTSFKSGSIPAFTDNICDYALGIEPFADGGQLKYYQNKPGGTLLWSGTTNTTSTYSFEGYGMYKAFVIVGKVLTSQTSYDTVAIAPLFLTTSNRSFQLTDNDNYYSFYMRYSGTTVYFNYRAQSGSGALYRVYGIR